MITRNTMRADGLTAGQAIDRCYEIAENFIKSLQEK